jgi:hypothetical protein
MLHTYNSTNDEDLLLINQLRMFNKPIKKKRIYCHYGPRGENKLIRYDHELARLAGVTGSIREDMIKLGAKITNYEDMQAYGCSLIEIEGFIKNPPHYTMVLNPYWDFSTSKEVQT